MSIDIKKEAREILDKFGSDLNSLNLKLKNVGKRGNSVREEGSGQKSNNEFKAIMFKNAKNKNDLYILTEKGAWN